MITHFAGEYQCRGILFPGSWREIIEIYTIWDDFYPGFSRGVLSA